MQGLISLGTEKLGLTLSEAAISQFTLFHEELKKWGSKINLTALIKDEKRVVEELFLDSIAPLLVIREGSLSAQNLLDIGSGGGFPGIPLKIAEPSLQIIMGDSIEKKIFFIRNAIRALSLSGVEAVKTRFCDEGSSEVETDCFDWAISKAVADIGSLGMWALPHLKKGGSLICMKGPAEELVAIKGYGEAVRCQYTLPFSGARRNLYVYEKI